MAALPNPTTLFNLSGKTAVISGASGALGAAAARALAGAGAHVVLVGGNSQRLNELQQEIEKSGASASSFVGRPQDEASADDIIAAATPRGGIDILVAAAGTAIVKPIGEMALDEWDQVMDANVRQVWLLARAASRAFIEQARGGKMILISSVRAQFATPAGTSAYGPSKSAINMLTRSLAVELGPHNVCVNAIAPTVIRSKLTAWLFEKSGTEARKNVLARIPVGRLGEPEDFNGAFMFLASSASDLMTGEIVNIDGGFSAN